MVAARKKSQVIYAFFKRFFDIVFGFIGCVVMLIFAPFVGAAIKIEDGGPIFFKQPRVGKNGKVFKLVKFRSMAVDNDVHDVTCADKETRVGKFIRKTSIDELPQLWNVLKGDMSLVGPRPWIEDYYKYMNKEQRRRQDVRPGMTGLAQVSGRNNIGIFEKINYDIEYIERYSFFFDIKVLFLTVKTVFSGDKVCHKKKMIGNDIDELRIKNEAIKTANPLVSIVVPVYNAEKYLPEAIESVLNQTYENWELIIVNDCSTDGSKKAAEPYLKDKRIRWVDLEKNSGAACSRNKGIDLAKGSFVAFIDADDLWKKNKLEEQIRFMLERDCEFSYTGYEFAKAHGKPNGKIVWVPSRIKYKQALKNTTIFTSTVMFNLEKLSKKDIKMPNVPSEDTATWWKVLKTIPMAYGMPGVYAYYRRSEGTLSSNKKEAIKRIWHLYRKAEKMSVLKSFYYFCFYAINAVRRRV